MQELEARLEEAGHSAWISYRGGLRVCPPAEEFIAVASGVEHVLYADDLRLLFGCRPDPAPILAWSNRPEPIASRWLDRLSLVAPGHSFDTLAVVGTWALAGVASWDEAHLWVDGGRYFRTSDGDAACGRIESILGTRVDFPPWRSHLVDGPSLATVPIDPRRDDLADLVAAYVLLAKWCFRDVHIARDDLSEVLAIGHDDDVVISLPDPDARSGLLGRLRAAPSLFVPAIVSDRLRGEGDDEEEEVDSC